MTTAAVPAAESAGAAGAVTARTAGKAPSRSWLSWLGAVPFLAYVGLFLLLPTGVVVFGSFFTADGQPTLGNLRALGRSDVLHAFRESLVVSSVSAVLGAFLGALLAYVVVTGRPHGMLRRVVTAASGVLAQSGGVTLAFSFIASVGSEGFVTLGLAHLGVPTDAGWLTATTGLIVVYLYFQIPLMVLVFIPALDGIRPQWREAAESLGASSWQYWRDVAVPLLTPPFLGAALLLFANAFAAYATAAALITQGSVIVPLQIRTALSSEVILGQENVGKALALGMVIVVALVMSGYASLQRRSSRWLR